MGQVLHGTARTTAVVRQAIQHSQESLATLAVQYGLNPKTIAKRKKRRWSCRVAGIRCCRLMIACLPCK
jgi:hypothetical protein